MAKQAKLKAVLTLDNALFVRNIKQATTLAKNLAKQFAANPIKTSFIAGALAASSAVKGTAKGLEKLASAAKTTFLAAGAGATAAAVAIGAISVKAIDAAASVETMQLSFVTLLGSTEKASARMKELMNFSKGTPFQFKDVGAASRKLEILTNGALSGAKGLQIVGDVASGTGRDFAETADTVGQLFAALREGGSAADPLEKLRHSGAINMTQKRQIESTASIGDGAGAWKLAQEALARFDGEMKRKSSSWEGMMSTFKDSIQNALVKWGEPLIAAIKPTLALATNVIFSLGPKIAAAGTQFAEGVKIAIGFIEEVFFDPSSLIDPVVLGLKAGFLEVGNVLLASVDAAASFMSNAWGAMGQTVLGIGLILQGSLIKAFSTGIAYLQAGIEKAMEMLPEALGGHAASDETMSQRVDRIKKDGVAEEAGNSKVQEGQGYLKSGASGLYDEAAKAFKSAALKDVLGAGDAAQKFKQSIRKTSEKGDVESYYADPGTSKDPNTEEKRTTAMDRFSEFASAVSPQGGLNTSGLKAVSMPSSSFVSNGGARMEGPAMLSEGAHGQTPLIKHREKLASEAATRAQIEGIQYAQTGVYKSLSPNGAVHRGDKARAKFAAQEKLREKTGLDKTNEILANLTQKFDQAWGAKGK